MTDIPEPPYTESDQEATDERLVLIYVSERGDTVVRRVRRNNGDTVVTLDQEFGYNYVKGTWELSFEHDYEHELKQDGVTLKGDGSGWDGAGRHWQEWYIGKHLKRLDIRFSEEIDWTPPISANSEALTQPQAISD